MHMLSAIRRKISCKKYPQLTHSGWGSGMVMNSHIPVDTKMQMPCHPKFSLDKHRSAQRGARSRGCSPRWKIHTPLLPQLHSESTEFKNMNQLQCKTQLSGHNTCILIDVNLDTVKPMQSQATPSFSITHTHKHTVGQINKSRPRLSSFRRLWTLWQAWVNMLFLLIHKD